MPWRRYRTLNTLYANFKIWLSQGLLVPLTAESLSRIAFFVWSVTHFLWSVTQFLWSVTRFFYG